MLRIYCKLSWSKKRTSILFNSETWVLFLVRGENFIVPLHVLEFCLKVVLKTSRFHHRYWPCQTSLHYSKYQMIPTLFLLIKHCSKHHLWENVLILKFSARICHIVFILHMQFFYISHTVRVRLIALLSTFSISSLTKEFSYANASELECPFQLEIWCSIF